MPKCNFCEKEINVISFYDDITKKEYHLSCSNLVQLIKTYPERVRKLLK